MEKELLKRVTAYRQQTFRALPGLKVHSIEEAVEFVNQRGFIFFWPIKGFEFPSLWTAATGGYTVPDNHDDPGHITWDWKDQMLGKRRWYYGRVLRRKNTMVSLEAFPYFYALTPNYGEYEVDYLSQYQQGLMTAEAKAIYEALLYEGPLDTISLRKTARMSSRSSDARFQRALDQLQVEMKILPTGVSQAGAWRYAFIYDIVPRHFPFIEAQAGAISEPAARAYLLSRCLQSLGLAEYGYLRKLFRWKDVDIHRAASRLVESYHLEVEEILAGSEKALALKEILLDR